MKRRDGRLRYLAVNVFCPTGEGGGVDATCSPGGGGVSIGGTLDRYYASRPQKDAEGKRTSDGRKVLKGVPNESSIESSMPGDYEVLSNIRDVSMDLLVDYSKPLEKQSVGGTRYAADDEKRVQALTKAIQASGKISPLIIVDDGGEYPYVLEGGHRADALARVGAKSFPAKVVIDTHTIRERMEKGEKLPDRLRGVVQNLAVNPTENRLTANAKARRALKRKKNRTSLNPSRIDPTRTATLRKRFSAEINRRFARIKGAILKLVGDEDAFGLTRTGVVRLNVFDPDQPRDEGGRWSSDGGGGGDAGNPETLKTDLGGLTDEFAKAAQEEYDAWEQDEEGMDEECGAGGICDRISGRIASVIAEKIPGAELFDGGQEGDEHAYSVVKVGDRAYAVDIPPGVYETGGGYSWKKIPGVTITSSDVVIYPVDADQFTENAGFFAECGRDEHGWCMPGGAGGDAIPTSVVDKATAAFDKLPGARLLREKAQVIKNGLVRRYGVKTAAAIVASGQAVAWASSAGFAAAGAPGAWIPSGVGMIPGVLIAEMHRAFRGPRDIPTTLPPATGNAEELTAEEIERLGRELLVELATLTANAFNPDQPRDEEGQWTSGGGGVAKTPGGEGYESYFEHQGQKFKIVLNPMPDNPKSWDLTFGIGDEKSMSIDMSKTGKAGLGAVSIFRKVGEAVDDFLRKEPGAGLEFSAEKIIPSRVRLYDRFIDVLAKRHGMTTKTEDTNVERRYFLTRNKHIAQNSFQHTFSHDFDLAAQNLPTANAGRWAFKSDPEKIKEFQKWLRSQLGGIKGVSDDQLWERFISEGFKRGAGRAFDDWRRSEKTQATRKEKPGFYAGRKEEFLRSAFAREETVDKLKILVSRPLDELDNVTSDMATRMTRHLADGLTRGAHPLEIAREMTEDVDIGRGRAERIARTEIIRAHAEGQLAAFEELGVEELGVAVEWTTAGDDAVCELCEPMEGVVLSIDEAKGMIPRHPNCRCAFIPANVGEDGQDQKTSRGAILRAVRLSQKRGGDDEDDEGWGPGSEIDKHRPESLFNAFAGNAVTPAAPAAGGGPNCGTGAGGFQPGNTCAQGGGGGASAGAVHAGSGLSIGHVITKQYKGTTYTVEVTQQGFQVSSGGIPQAVYASLTAAAKGIRQSNTAVSGPAFFGVAAPVGAAAATAAPTAPTPAPVVLHSSGLPVGATYTKAYGGGTHTMTVTQQGFEVNHANGTTQTYKSLSAAAVGIKGNNVATNGWAFFGIDKPGASAPVTAPTPKPAPGAPTSTVPYAPETSWATGERQSGVVLNGVPFATATPKFWTKTKDVDLKEPKPTKPIERALCMVEEPDGRVWIVEPTGHFGGRKHTVPGGTVEKGLTLQQNALKETFEETGLQVEITKYLGDITDSNNGRNGRLYLAKRVSGAPWDAKIESSITNPKTGQPAAESETVKLVTKERAAQLLHRTDDLAMLATVAPIKLNTDTKGKMMQKLVEGIKPAANAYEKSHSTGGNSPGSSTLHAVQELRGFNDKPTVVSKSDMDSLIAKGGHIEMLRGVRRAGSRGSAELAEDFRSGEHYPGFGCFGNGTYCDGRSGIGNVAIGQYGRGGEVLRIALPKSAKIIKQSELEAAVPSAPGGFYEASTGHTDTDRWRGVHAALAGYDAIKVDGKSHTHGSYGKGFYVILNRSILTVQKESAKGHVIR